MVRAPNIITKINKFVTFKVYVSRAETKFLTFVLDSG